MKFWQRKDEKILRRALRQTLRQHPTVQKLFRKAPKAACHRPLLMLALLFPLGIFLPWIGSLGASFLSKFPSPDVLAAYPLAFAFSAWIAANGVHTHLQQATQLDLYKLLPIEPIHCFKHAARSGTIKALLIPTVVTLTFLCFLFKINTQPAAYALSLLHILAMLLTCPYSFWLRRFRPVWKTAPLILLTLFAVTLTHSIHSPGEAHRINALALLLPNGWVAKVIQAFSQKEWAVCILWLTPLIAASIATVKVFTTERRQFIHQLLRADAAPAPSLKNTDDLEEETEFLRQFGWVESIVKTQVGSERYAILELCAGQPIHWSTKWKTAGILAVSGTIISFIPVNLAHWIGGILGTLAVLRASPVFGGSWAMLQTNAPAHGAAHPLALYPISLKATIEAALSSNYIRLASALPIWGLLAIAVGNTSGATLSSLKAVGMIWASVVAYLPMLTLINITQCGVSCISGKWWRIPVSITLLLCWLVHAIAVFVLAVYSSTGRMSTYYWAGSALLITLSSFIFMRINVHQCSGRSFDYLITPRSSY